MAPTATTADQRRADQLHLRGRELLAEGRPVSAARVLRQGLRLVAEPDGPAPAAGVRPGFSSVAARMLTTLAITELELGRADDGFALLDTAETLAGPGERGVVVQQRGLMLVVIGRMDEALARLNEAVGLLARSGEDLVLARTLLNRGLLHHNAGRIRLARADLASCEELARPLGQPLMRAKATHNIGHCDLLSGKITDALRNFEAAASAYRVADTPALLGVVSVDRARVLLAAGLFTEAATELDAALPLIGRYGARRDRAEAALTRAQVAVAAGDWAQARRWAGRAERSFRSQGNHPWAAVAALTRLQTDFHQGRQLAATAGRAEQLADRLRSLGLHNDADAAALLAARANGAVGRRELAEEGIRRCRSRTMLDNRVQRRLALAELCAAAGDTAGVRLHCRLGLRLLGRHRSRFGSIDLRTGSAALGVELARMGLDAALAGGSPAQVFSWLERSRAQSFRARPVRPPVDARTTDIVAELRHLAGEIRAAELEGRRDPAARRRCAELERAVRAHGWQADGAGERADTPTLSQVRAELSAAGAALVSLAVHAGQLIAVVVSERGAWLRRLSSWDAVTEAAARLHRDIDALCDRVLPSAIDTVVRSSARRQSAELTRRIVAPLRRLVGDRELVLVPTRSLMAVPWSVLPELRGRPLTVAPSASAWLHARRTPAAADTTAPPVLVAGPDLRHAAAEVAEIARVRPAAVVLQGDAATVPAVLDRLDGGSVVHIAAHGHHEQDNVLFSRLDLIGGPLMAYDVQLLRAAPSHVVLPSCDVGRTVVRRGDELLGFTAALLYMGTRSVVSCVNRVLDERSVQSMTRYHRALQAGHSPARALADACADDPLSPFVCFGAG